jgi:hypothetical protein
LCLHVSGTNGFGKFQQSVGQSTLSVVNMCNDAKIPDTLHKAAKISVSRYNYEACCPYPIKGEFVVQQSTDDSPFFEELRISN